MPTARFCAASAVVNGMLYVIGGFSTGPTSLDDRAPARLGIRLLTFTKVA